MDKISISFCASFLSFSPSLARSTWKGERDLGKIKRINFYHKIWANFICKEYLFPHNQWIIFKSPVQYGFAKCTTTKHSYRDVCRFLGTCRCRTTWVTILRWHLISLNKRKCSNRKLQHIAVKTEAVIKRKKDEYWPTYIFHMIILISQVI